MTIVPFVPPIRQSVWYADEVRELDRLMRLLTTRLGAQSWQIGATDAGDPQFYAFGPEPEQSCIASVSRMGATYILEDGHGRVLGERDSLHELVRSAKEALPRPCRWPVMGKIVVAICAVRATIEEKILLLEESAELLSRVAPQLAAFA